MRFPFCRNQLTDRRNQLRYWLVLLVLVAATFPRFAVAQSSPNFDVLPGSSSGSPVQSSSPSYELQGSVGPSSPIVTSPNYELVIGSPPPFIPPPATGGGGNPVPDAIQKGIEAILDTTKDIVNALPTPIRETAKNAAEAITNLVSTLQQSEAIAQTVESFVKPLTRTAAIVTAVAAAGSFSFQFSNLAYLLFRLGYFWFVPLGVKRRQPWGVVFDSITGRPIKGIVIRIFSKEFDKLRETRVTDEEGRFGFFVDVGEYYVHAAKPGFTFPSRLLTAQALSRYPNLYRGEIIRVREKREGAINVNIPVDAETSTYSRARLIRIRVLNFIAYLLDRLNNPLLILGTGLSWVTLIVDPTPTNYGVLGFYGVLLFVKLLLGSQLRRSFGRVRDGATKKPLELSLVRIFDAKGGNIVSTRVTDRDGQFTALVRPGDYYAIVTKNGYEVFRSPAVTVPKGKAVLRLDVDLKPMAAHVAPPIAHPAYRPAGSPSG